jgi:hypothetical protein
MTIADKKCHSLVAGLSVTPVKMLAKGYYKLRFFPVLACNYFIFNYFLSPSSRFVKSWHGA